MLAISLRCKGPRVHNLTRPSKVRRADSLTLKDRPRAAAFVRVSGLRDTVLLDCNTRRMPGRNAGSNILLRAGLDGGTAISLHQYKSSLSNSRILKIGQSR